MTDQTFTLSIEPTGEKAFLHHYHLGTIESVARDCAEHIFKSRNACAAEWQRDLDGRSLYTTTVALLRGGKLFAVYDGTWDVLAKPVPYNGNWG